MSAISDKKLQIAIGIFLLGGIVAWILIPTSFSADTIILTTPSGVDSCLGADNFVLAQNLTDLCDVTITNPVVNELVVYNGTQWVNDNVTSATGVTSLTSDNDAIVLNASSGNVLISPAYRLLCNNVLGSSNSSLVCDLPETPKYLRIELNYRIVTSTLTMGVRFNGDNDTDYSVRSSVNGGADVTSGTIRQCTLRGGVAFASGDRGIIYLDGVNISGDRKLFYGHASIGGDTGSATAPIRLEQACKYVDTSAQISKVVIMITAGTGTFDTGSTLWVWGHD